MTITFPTLLVQNFQTVRLLALGSYAPETYVVPVQPSGNSLLSSLLVLSLDPGATVRVNYFQTTAGNEFEERTNIVSHDVVSVGSTQAQQILVTRIHNKVFAEVVVSGGTCVLGVTASVVSSFATDLETALKRDGQVSNLLLDRGFPMMGLDDDGTFQFLPFVDGRLQVDAAVNLNPGTPVFASGEALSVIASVETDLIDYTVPTGKKLKLARVQVSGNNIATYELLIDGASAGKLWTWFNGSLSGSFDFSPAGILVLAGDKVEVKVTHERPFVGDFSCLISGTLEDA